MKRRNKKTHSVSNSSPLHTPQTSLNINFSAATSRRSAPRNPRKSFASLPKQEFDDNDDDDEEGKERKVELVVGLPEFQGDEEFTHKREKKRLHSTNGDPNEECGDQREKREISVFDSGSGEDVFEVKDCVKVTDAPKDGSYQVAIGVRSHYTLPDKKLLSVILDKLQKKDTHSVFSEPVDIDELPDYFDVIEQPMDFGTVRKKLDSGAYKNLEQLEVDIFLICSNAMQYNDPDTVFYRQARAIRELAKREFENLRNEGGDDVEPQIKIVRRRGRPPSKNKLKKSMDESYPAERGVSSDAKPDDKTLGSCGYNLRKAPAVNRFKSNDQFVSSYRLRNGENYSDYSEWNNEFPASILRADMRYGKKQFTLDETRRDTFRSQSTSNRLPQLIVPVGIHEPLAYASSLARFAANLGSVAQKMASRRIESISPSGVEYGPGWINNVAEPSSLLTEWQKSASTSCAGGNQNQLLVSATSNLVFTTGAYPPPQEPPPIKVASKGELSPWKTPFSTLQQRNG